MNRLVELAREAQRAAAETRRWAEAMRDLPICVFDLAEKLGLEVRFRPETTLEGMYSKGSPGVILVPTHRPPGRQAFSCAHELGHHVLGHGTKVDDYLAEGYEASRNDPEERLADFFAAHLLMPIAAVRRAFASRNWDIAKVTAQQAYIVACYLGVGYDSLINHMRWALRMLDGPRLAEMQRHTPKQIRLSLLGEAFDGHLVIVDDAWVGRSVDLSIGDRVILPSQVRLEGRSIALCGCQIGHTIIQGVRAGVSRVESSDGSWAAYVRVARREYVGRNRFRFDEDPDEDECAPGHL